MGFAIIPHAIKNINLTGPNKITSTTGKILWQEDFSSNQNKFTGGTLDNTAQKVRNGGYSLKLTTSGTDPWTTTIYSKVVSMSPRLLNSNIGIEFYVQPGAETTASGGLDSLYVEWKMMDGTTEHKIRVALKFGATDAEAKLQYLNSGNVLTDISGSTFRVDQYYFYRIKVVFDPISKKYVRVEFGNKIYDLSGISYRTASSSFIETILTATVIGIDATTVDNWFDSFVITYDEPS